MDEWEQAATEFCKAEKPDGWYAYHEALTETAHTLDKLLAVKSTLDNAGIYNLDPDLTMYYGNEAKRRVFAIPRGLALATLTDYFEELEARVLNHTKTLLHSIPDTFKPR